MKKKFALILAIAFVSTLFVGFPTAFAAVPIGYDFNGAVAISPWTVSSSPTSETLTAEIVNVSDGNDAVKLVAMANGTALNNGSTKAFILQQTANAGLYATYSFDFMIESTSGDDEYVLGTVLKSVSGAWGTSCVPVIKADNTLGSGTWETGKWYTCSSRLNVVTGLCDTYMTDKLTGIKTLIAEGISFGATNLSGISKIEIHPMKTATVWLDNISVKTSNPLAILTPSEGSVINNTGNISVSGTLETGYTQAALYIDDIQVKTIEAGLDSFSIDDIDVSSYNYGRHKIVVSAVYEGVTRTAENTVVFSPEGKQIIWDAFPQSGNSGNQNGVNYTFSGLSGGTVVNNNGSYLYTKGSESTVAMAYTASAAFRSGVIKIELDTAFSNTSTSLTIEGKNGSGVWAISNSIPSSNFATANQSYKLGIIVDTAAKNYKMFVGNTVVRNINDNRLDSLSYITFKFSTPTAGNTITISDIDFSRTFTMPYPKQLSSFVKGIETAESGWPNGKVNKISDAIAVVFSDTLDAAAVTPENVMLKKVENGIETEVATTPSVSGGEIILTLSSEAFEANKKYKICLNNMTFNSVAYSKPIEVFFETAALFDIVYPSNGLRAQAVGIASFIATVPDEPESVTFKIDGNTLSTPVVNGVEYSVPVALSATSLGRHVFEVEAVFDGIMQTREVTFETYKNLPEKTAVEYSNINRSSYPQVSQCDGSDGATNSGIMLTATSLDTCFAIQPNATNMVVMFSADIKRGEGCPFMLETVDRSGATAWGHMGLTNPIIAANGKIAGTDTVFEANKWHKLVIISDLVTKACTILLDEAVVKTGTETAMPSFLSELKMQIPSGNAGKTLCFDNVEFAQYLLNPSATNVAYKMGDTFTDASNYTISAAPSEIKITMSDSFDSLQAGDVLINNEAVSSVICDENDIIITLAEPLPTNSLCVITFDDALTVHGFAMSLPYSIALKTNSDFADSIGSINFIGDTDSATASISIIKSNCNSLLGDSVMITVASYNGNKLEAIITEVEPISVGTNIESLTLNGLGSGTVLMAFVWSPESYTPLTDAAQIKR